jgi:hypothetical protein
MSTPLVASHTRERTRRPILRSVMIAGLVGNVLVFAGYQLLIRTLIPPLAVTLALQLVVALVCATRWRWAPHLAVLWCVLSSMPALEPYCYNLSHPTATVTFIATLLGITLLLVTVVAGVAAIVSGERQAAERRAPRWLTGFLIGTGRSCSARAWSRRSRRLKPQQV